MAFGVGAIVVAAGNSSRMAGTDKLWLDLGGKPLLARTLEAIIAGCDDLTELVVVAGMNTRDRVAAMHDALPWSRVDHWVPGGETRQDSVYCGLQALAPCELVLVHDGARPLLRREVVLRGLAAARRHGAVLATTPVTDTIKIVDADSRVRSTPERASLQAAQTPQIFSWISILEAYERVGVERSRCTDDAGVLELAGFPVYTFLGDRTNLKVSTPEDVVLVQALSNAYDRHLL